MSYSPPYWYVAALVVSSFLQPGTHPAVLLCFRRGFLLI
nr:MAG TPA: hypothetical protein [Caudoviricetes sp.]